MATNQRINHPKTIPQRFFNETFNLMQRNPSIIYNAQMAHRPPRKNQTNDLPNYRTIIRYYQRFPHPLRSQNQQTS